MDKPAVLVEGVGKRFSLSLKAAMKHGLMDSGRRLFGLAKPKDLRSSEFWALDNICFRLETGDALGIMGINGSGKTTLLRILNGTYAPDTGRVTMRGRIGALIAAGAGFSPMLSGRENIHINGTLLGMTPTELRGKFDEIVAFAELDEFLDMPVRNYSSGMVVRLGFAIAVLGAPDILLVDEVLAVGDIRFQKKCFERIQNLKKNGTTILLVSHSPGAIWAVCNKGLLIDRGHSDGIIGVEEACKEYDHVNMRARAPQFEHHNMRHTTLNSSPPKLPVKYGGIRGGSGDVLITAVEIVNGGGQLTSEAEFGQDFQIRLQLQVFNTVKAAIFRIQVDAEINKAIAIIDSYEVSGGQYDLNPGEHTVMVRVNKPNLRPGVYSFSPSITTKNIGVHLFFEHNMAQLMIKHVPNLFLYADFRASVQLDAAFTFL